MEKTDKTIFMNLMNDPKFAKMYKDSREEFEQYYQKLKKKKKEDGQ